MTTVKEVMMSEVTSVALATTAVEVAQRMTTSRGEYDSCV